MANHIMINHKSQISNFKFQINLNYQNYNYQIGLEFEY